MNRNVFTAMAGLLVGLSLSPSTSLADTDPDALLTGLFAEGKYAFVLFYRDADPVTRALDQGLANELARRGDRAGGARVAVTDPAAKALVRRLGIARAPMPLVVAFAPNGAITGMFTKKLTPELVDGAFVTPGMMACLKALQEKKLVLVRVVPRQAHEPLPAAAAALQMDPRYKGRVTLVSIASDNQEEQRFCEQLEVADDPLQEPVMVLLAPPGVLVGRFSLDATAGELMAKLEAAAKCCEDPNCKHHKQGN